jgi:cytolysin-activating lysine-acyltransferase
VSKQPNNPSPQKDIKIAPRAAAKAVPSSPPQRDAQTLMQQAAARSKMQATLGRVVLAMTTTPRYRHLPIGDLTSLILDPLLRDRIAIASPAHPDGTPNETELIGIAIWASVSETVDFKIREQITAGVFPVRLQPEDWNSGPIHWLLDVLSPNAQMATAVVSNFKKVVKDAQVLVHPRVTASLQQNEPRTS